MMYEDDKRERKSIRLKDYDYSSAGAYFVTICTHSKQSQLGEIVNGEMNLSAIGQIAKACWMEIPKHFDNTILDEFIIMPNHVHGIIGITDSRGVQLNAPTGTNHYSTISPRKNTLSVIIRTYKAAVTRSCRQQDYHVFQWQRNYFERILRNQKNYTESAGTLRITHRSGNWMKKILSIRIQGEDPHEASQR